MTTKRQGNKMSRLTAMFKTPSGSEIVFLESMTRNALRPSRARPRVIYSRVRIRYLDSSMVLFFTFSRSLNRQSCSHKILLTDKETMQGVGNAITSVISHEVRWLYFYTKYFGTWRHSYISPDNIDQVYVLQSSILLVFTAWTIKVWYSYSMLLNFSWYWTMSVCSLPLKSRDSCFVLLTSTSYKLGPYYVQCIYYRGYNDGTSYIVSSLHQEATSSLSVPYTPIQFTSQGKYRYKISQDALQANSFAHCHQLLLLY